jgi:hypothetical protein
VENTGDAPDPLVTVTLPIPAGAVFAKPSGEADATARSVTWRITHLAPGTSKQLCADFTAPEPGLLTFASSAIGAAAPLVEAPCTTRVMGIPAILLEVIDVSDPIELGQQETYEITVLNQGSTTLTRVQLVCTLEDSQEFVSGGGATAVEAQDRTVTIAPLRALAPQAAAKWNVVVKALAVGDVRFAVELASDEFQRPIRETEATQQY